MSSKRIRPATVFLSEPLPLPLTRISVSGQLRIYRLTSEDVLLPDFEGLNVPMVVCGHTHMQFDRMVGKIRIVNARSVGLPYGKSGTYWPLLGPNIELRHVGYDLTEAAEHIRDTEYLQAQDFAERNVLQPPSEAESLEVFRRAEL